MGRSTLRSLVAAALGLACAGCGGSAGEATAPAEPAAEDEAAGGAESASSCREAYADYVRAWTRWFKAERYDEEAVAQMVAAFEEELPMRAALAEMREVAVELRYEPGFERWLVALDATEHAIELCGEGAGPPDA